MAAVMPQQIVDPGARADRLQAALAEAAGTGFAGFAADQADALESFWRHAELSIDGDAASEQALRFNLFHLLQSAGRTGVDGRVRLAPAEPGVWLLSAVHLVDAPAASGARWESLWSSLTFEVAAAR